MPTPPEGVKLEKTPEPVVDTPAPTERAKYMYKGSMEVDPANADALIEKGYAAFQAEEDAKAKENEVVITEDDDSDVKYAKLLKRQENMESKINTAMEQSALQQKYSQVSQAVDTLIANDPFIAQYPDVKQAAEKFTKSYLYHNPNIPIEHLYKQVIEEIRPLVTSAKSTYVKKKAEQAASTLGERTSSGDVVLNEEHKTMTRKDLRSGKGRASLMKLISSGKAFKEN